MGIPLTAQTSDWTAKSSTALQIEILVPTGSGANTPEGVLQIKALPGSLDDDRIELSVEDGNLVIGRQLENEYKSHKKAALDKTTVPTADIPSREIEVYGGGGTTTLS